MHLKSQNSPKMENQNQTPIKSQISKFLQSTFNSCRPNTTSDVSDHRRTPRRLIDLFSPKPKPQPPPPKNPKPQFSRQKNIQIPPNSGRRSKYSVSPVHEKPEKPAKLDKKKKTHHRRRPSNPSFSSITDNYYYNWWSSDDQDDQKSRNTLFSRRSISSNSDESGCENVAKAGVVAVAKDSSDPYEDFRVSMVDMIVEKELFGVEELENLVECFIKLNDEEHHKVIFEVFAEIWEVLIGDDYSKKKE